MSTQTEANKERRRNQKVSRNDFADLKPWQNGKQRRHEVGTGERGDEIEREAMNIRRKKQKKEKGDEETEKETEKERGNPGTWRKKRTPLCF